MFDDLPVVGVVLKSSRDRYMISAQLESSGLSVYALECISALDAVCANHPLDIIAWDGCLASDSAALEFKKITAAKRPGIILITDHESRNALSGQWPDAVDMLIEMPAMRSELISAVMNVWSKRRVF
jgi:CheY-like chemotaxis protein